jgi:transposase
MDNKTEAQIRYDHAVNGLSYRSLGTKYGIGHTTIYGMVKRKAKRLVKATEIQQTEQVAAEEPLPDDLKTLKQALREARLVIELQDIMINIAGKELGVDLRKKHGTRQSK